MNIKTRKTIESDKRYLYELRKRCYFDVVNEQFGTWNEEWQTENFDKKWDPSKYEILVYEKQDIGAIRVKYETTHVFISEILIDSPFQNRGYGTFVLKRIFEEGQASGLPVKLQVLHKNKAISLYKKLGMRIAGRNETHILMELLV